MEQKNEYNEITSKYYKLYRPNLHELILKGSLKENKKFKNGLDIGSGVGHSTVALSEYCEKVKGVEPSIEMLNESKKHPKVEYSKFNGTELEFKNNCFDIVTLAGSLYYSKSQKLYDEIIRVCEPKSIILIYDFEIDMNIIKNQLGLSLRKNDYDHQIDFNKLDLKDKVEKVVKNKGKIKIQMSKLNMIYLLLSDRNEYEELKNKYGAKDIERKILSKINNERLNGLIIELESNIYYTKYKLIE